MRETMEKLAGTTLNVLRKTEQSHSLHPVRVVLIRCGAKYDKMQLVIWYSQVGNPSDSTVKPYPKLKMT